MGPTSSCPVAWHERPGRHGRHGAPLSIYGGYGAIADVGFMEGERE